MMIPWPHSEIEFSRTATSFKEAQMSTACERTMNWFFSMRTPSSKHGRERRMLSDALNNAGVNTKPAVGPAPKTLSIKLSWNEHRVSDPDASSAAPSLLRSEPKLKNKGGGTGKRNVQLSIVQSAASATRTAIL